MKSLREILSSGAAYLDARHVEGARASMQAMAAHVLGTNRTWLYSHIDYCPTDAQLDELREMLRKRGQGVPLQHLLGETEFYRRSFRSDKRALIPRPETEELVELALQLTRRSMGLRVLDMGCGSGVIGITLALELRELKPLVVMADISAAALDLALENATALGAQVRTYCSNLFSAWKSVGNEGEGDSRIMPPAPFDLMVANLPYVAPGEELQKEVRFEPSQALFGGKDGVAVIRRFVEDAREYLAPGGTMLLEVGHSQGEIVAASLCELGYEKVEVRKDMAGVNRFVSAHRGPGREQQH